jgi:hypothetical protein
LTVNKTAADLAEAFRRSVPANVFVDEFPCRSLDTDPHLSVLQQFDYRSSKALWVIGDDYVLIGCYGKPFDTYRS